MSVVVFESVYKIQTQLQTTEKAAHGLHVHKVVVVIHQFQQQLMFRLVQPLRQLVVAGSDFLLKFRLLQRRV